MVKKKEISQETLDLKKEVEEKRAILGASSVLKQLKDKNLVKVYLASNCPENIKGDINYYSALVNVPVLLTSLTNEEIGILCKKHFFVSVLGIKKKVFV